MKRFKIFLVVIIVFLLPMVACKKASKSNDTKLLYQGHASLKLTSKDGTVVYVDPFAGVGYDAPADVILVTHQHPDHNKVELVTQKKDCTLISNVEALKDGKHNTFNVKGIAIEAVEASNANHDPKECVGYIITIDGIKLYVAGDTSKIAQMDTFAAKKFDYALFPCDGVYNMDAKEAAECAKIVGAKNNIPYHTKPEQLFDKEVAENFDAPNRLIVEAGSEIKLVK
jgi:L-ascorbate metabolism protein UlaG (beta-lactamase superfamily)